MPSFAILGGDMRQACLAEQLRQHGYSVSVFRVPGLADTAASLARCVQNADVLILPMPAFDSAQTIRSHDGISTSEFLSSCPPDALVCGGILAPVDNLFSAHGLRAFDYAQDDTLTLENAELTAEAALPLLFSHLSVPLSGSSFLICGFGRIGKLLSRKLAALGVHVCVSARRQQDLSLAKILGYRCETTGVWQRGLDRYHAIVNTVPAEVFPAAQLSSIRPGCVLLELASLPGGFCRDAHTYPGFLDGRGLPGRYAPDAAAAIVRRAIFRKLSLEETA